jgi:hypothetical protein
MKQHGGCRAVYSGNERTGILRLRAISWHGFHDVNLSVTGCPDPSAGPGPGRPEYTARPPCIDCPPKKNQKSAGLTESGLPRYRLDIPGCLWQGMLFPDYHDKVRQCEHQCHASERKEQVTAGCHYEYEWGCRASLFFKGVSIYAFNRIRSS